MRGTFCPPRLFLNGRKDTQYQVIYKKKEIFLIRKLKKHTFVGILIFDCFMRRVSLFLYHFCIACLLCGCSTISHIVRNEFKEANPEDILENTAAEYIVSASIDGEAGKWIAGQMVFVKDYLVNAFEDSVIIRQPEEGLLLVFDSDRIFKQGKADINDNSSEVLQALATALTQLPNTRLYILVHTDNSSSEFIALALTDKRAKKLKKSLKSKGLKISRITAEGRGFMVPVISNESSEGRKLNRRVEMAVTANHKMIRQAIKSTKAVR